VGLLRLPNQQEVQVDDNRTIQELASVLSRQGIRNPIFYDPQERRPVLPNERIGNRTLRVLDQSEVGVSFSRPADEYERLGWTKLSWDLVVGFFRGESGLPIVAFLVVSPGSRWLCGEDGPCVLLASIDEPHNVRDFLVNHRHCCDSTIKVPDEFINAINNLLVNTRLNPNLCKVHFEKPLDYVDDASLIISVTRVLTDPKNGFGLEFGL